MNRSSVRHIVALCLTACIALAPQIRAASAPEIRVEASQIAALIAEPPRLQLRAGEQVRVLITARLHDGFEADVTDIASLSAALPQLLKLEAGGAVRGTEAGETVLVATMGAQRIEIPVHVAPVPADDVSV